MGKEPNIENHLVSVIIPTYNRAEQLRFCLDRLLEQTYKNFEVIVCDDGSTDSTELVTKEYNSRLNIKYSNDHNFGGPAKPRNRGIMMSEGDIIAFLDSDDWWYPTKLEESLKYIDNYDVVYHNLDKYTNYKRSNGVVKGRVLEGEVAQNLVVNGGIPNSSVVIKKAIVNKVGEISEDKSLIAVEDSDYWIRTALVTQKFKFIDKSLGGYWIGDNISVSEKQIGREEALFNKHKGLITSEQVVLAAKLMAFRKARIYHKMMKFDEAKREYLISLKSNEISVKIKSIAGFILSLLRIKF